MITRDRKELEQHLYVYLDERLKVFA